MRQRPNQRCERCIREHRSTLCRHRTPLRSERSPERRKRMPARNAKRAARKFERNFHSTERVAWVNAKACAYCGADDDTIRNDHVTKRGAGGAGGDYTRILPACHACDTVRENKSLQALLKLRGLTMADVEWKLAALNREWREYSERGARNPNEQEGV